MHVYRRNCLAMGTAAIFALSLPSAKASPTEQVATGTVQAALKETTAMESDFTDTLLNLASQDPTWTGATWDDGSQTLTVYAHGELSPDVQRFAANPPAGITVRLADAPFNYSELSEARTRAFKQSSQVASVSIPSDGTGIRVGVFSERGDLPQAELQAIANGLDVGVPVVAYNDEAPGQYGRMSDTAPFQGGGRIVNKATGGGCTAGFAAVNQTTANEVMLTASHCGKTGEAFDTGGGIDIGSLSPNVYNQMDAQAIQGQNYAAAIFVGDRLTSTRRDVSDLAGVVATGEIFCMSGSYTGSVCNSEVIDPDYMPSSSDGPYAVLHQRNNVDAAGQGDSGGPVYAVVPNTNNAKILGSILGPRYPDSQDICNDPVVRLCSDTIYVNVFRRYKDNMNLRLMTKQ